jgi:hypothetical protein
MHARLTSALYGGHWSMCDKYDGLEAKSAKGLKSDHAAAPGKSPYYKVQNADWTPIH